MALQSKYSIVFQPYEKEILQVKALKDKLAESIGWFSSKDSKAHISIAEFMADEQELQQATAFLRDFVRFETRQYVYLDTYAAFVDKGTWYVKPTVPSKLFMQAICNRLCKDFPLTLAHLPADLHLTIARRLSAEQLQETRKILKTIDLDFLCDRIVLRRFDPSLRQYQEYESFTFGGQTPVLISADEQGQIPLF